MVYTIWLSLAKDYQPKYFTNTTVIISITNASTMVATNSMYPNTKAIISSTNRITPTSVAMELIC